MKNYRIGNTLTIKWTLTQTDGTAYLLSENNVELWVSVPNHRFQVTDFTVDDNVVTWRFDGNIQKYPGPYTLTLVENRGEVDMMTVDFCEAFGLVKYSCLSGGTDTPGVVTESVELSSAVSMSQIGLSPEVEDVIRDSIADYGLILRDLGLYPTALSLALSVGKSGKYVDPDGQEVTSASMSISAPLQLKAGNIYLFQSSQAVGVGVSLFARQVTRTYDKVIVYTTLEEDAEGRPVKVQADYDISLVYTIAYDDDGNPTYEDAEGEPIESLPATHEVTESFYEPLFRTNDTSMPESGYYLFLCTTDMDVVISGYTEDVTTGKSLLGVRYGAFATIATNFVGTPGQKVLAQALCQLDARIKTLESLVDQAGHLKVELLDMADLPLVCGEKMYMTGSGAPSVPPTVPFQEYYDEDSGITYKAKGVLPNTPTVSDWKALN